MFTSSFACLLYVYEQRDYVSMWCFVCMCKCVCVHLCMLQLLHFWKSIDWGSGKLLCRRVSELRGRLCLMAMWGGLSGGDGSGGGWVAEVCTCESDFSNEGVTGHEWECLFMWVITSFLTPTTFLFGFSLEKELAAPNLSGTKYSPTGHQVRPNLSPHFRLPSPKSCITK